MVQFNKLNRVRICLLGLCEYPTKHCSNAFSFIFRVGSYLYYFPGVFQFLSLSLSQVISMGSFIQIQCNGLFDFRFISWR